MKKKSLLILPVLLLALAACNKEDEVEVPEDDTVTTEPSGDESTGGATQGGDEKEEEEKQSYARISLPDYDVVLNEVEEGERTAVTYANPSDGSLYIAETTVDDENNVTYVLGGTPSTMNDTQAADFWSGHAAEDDKYIVITVSFEPDEAVSWVSSAGDTRVRTIKDYEDGKMDVIIRISGKDVSADKLAGTATYTIGPVPEEGAEVIGVNHIVDFTALFDTRITVATGEASLTDNNVSPATATYTNTDDLAIASVKTDESGNVTYVLSGTANTMDGDQAQVYWNNVATSGDAYFVVTVSLKVGEKVSWTSPAGAKYVEYANAERTGEEDMVLRISGTSSYSDSSATTVVFTISTSSPDSSVTHTVDFSALLPEVEEE